MLSSEAIILTPRSLKQQVTENFSLQCLDMFFCCMTSCRCSLYICLFLYPWLKCTWPWNSHYMFTMCKHLALICLCSRWLVGDLWPSQVTPSPEWNMLCTDPIEYKPNVSKRKKKTSVYLSFIIKIQQILCLGAKIWQSLSQNQEFCSMHIRIQCGAIIMLMAPIHYLNQCWLLNLWVSVALTWV